MLFRSFYSDQKQVAGVRIENPDPEDDDDRVVFLLDEEENFLFSGRYRILENGIDIVVTDFESNPTLVRKTSQE